MENQNNFSVPPEMYSPEKPGILALIFRVFYQPSGVFGFLTKKTDWLIPLIITAVIGSTLGYLVRPIYVQDREKIAMERIEKYRDQIPTDRYNEIIENMSEQFAKAKANEYTWYLPLVAIALPFVFFAIITVIGLLTGNFVFGGKAGFWIVMNVVAFASLVGLLGDVVRMALMLAKGSSYIYMGLGMLKPVDDGSFMYYLFSQIDVFSIWRIAATCIGLGVIYKMKPSKFAYVLFTVWIIFIAAVALGNSTIFMGGIVY